MSDEYGRNLQSILDALESTEERKIREGKIVVRSCRYCQGDFHVKRSWQTFCNKRCRELYHKQELAEAALLKAGLLALPGHATLEELTAWVAKHKEN